MTDDLHRRRTSADYTIACICPLGVELAPVEGMLDEIHDPVHTVRNQNAYTLGSMGGHNIVVAVMPEVGNNAAASTVTQLLNDFPAVRFGLLVGIGGGIPGDADVRLGDVVVGQPTGEFPGVVQYDIGKDLAGGRFQRTGSLNKPPAELCAHVRKLDGQHRRLGHDLRGHLSDMLQRYPMMKTDYSFSSIAGQDRLFLATYEHQSGPTCDRCDHQYLVPRSARPEHEPRIHYGTIGSANKVVKDAQQRDKIYVDVGALCIEMEAAGLMSDFPCLVIRGVCDYADSHKNNEWQPYAAAIAAAYAKALLQTIPVQEVSLTGRAVESTIPSELLISGRRIRTLLMALQAFRIGLHLTEAPVIEDDLCLDRVTELQAMEEILQPRGLTPKHRRLILGGMGGVGKTQMAIAYAKQYCHDYNSIFWLNATAESFLKQSYRLVAQRILSVEQYQGIDDDQILLYVTRWLSDTRNTRWLLVFDNHDDPSAYDIGKYCPSGLYGSVIITTRCPDQIRGHQFFVRPLEDINQSLDILATRSKRPGVSTDPHAMHLARRLQGLPLALATVGAYLKHSPWPFEKYLQLYEKQFNIDNHRPTYLPEYRDRTLHTTWDITYARLEANHPEAARLLRSFAFFDNQNIQYGLFCVRNDHSGARKLAKMRSRLRSFLREETQDSFLKWLQQMSIDDFTSAMHTLTEYCFVEVRSAHGNYSIHSCVHDWALSALSSGTQSNGYWFAFDRIADMINNIARDCYSYPIHSTITPHAVRLAHVSFSSISYDASPGRLNSTHTIADFLHAQLELEAAEQMYLKALTGKERVLGPDHTRTLATVNNLGTLYMDQGKLDAAEQMYNRALAGYEKTLKPDHPWTLFTVHGLGNLYRDQGKLDKAEQMYRRALAGSEKAFRAKHPQRMLQLVNHASLFIVQHKLREATEIYQQIITICADRRVDATSRSEYLIKDCAVALGNSASIFRDTLVDARPHILRLIELVQKQGSSNIIAIQCLAKALLHVRDDESVERVLLCYTPPRWCNEALDLGGVRCNACHHRMNITTGINVCRDCVSTVFCDGCLSERKAGTTLGVIRCDHDQFCGFGVILRQTLTSPRNRDPAEVKAFWNTLHQRYPSPMDQSTQLQAHASTG